MTLATLVQGRGLIYQTLQQEEMATSLLTGLGKGNLHIIPVPPPIHGISIESSSFYV